MDQNANTLKQKWGWRDSSAFRESPPQGGSQLSVTPGPGDLAPHTDRPMHMTIEQQQETPKTILERNTIRPHLPLGSFSTWPILPPPSLNSLFVGLFYF